MYRKTICRACRFLAVAALAIAVSPAQATSLVALDLAELTRQSEHVFTGRVVATESRFENGRFHTISTIEVGENFHGSIADTVRIRQPGGSAEINGLMVGETVAGVSAIVADAEHVYFVSRSESAGEYGIVGFSQGQLGITGTDENRTVLSPDSATPVPLDVFAEQVRSIAGN